MTIRARLSEVARIKGEFTPVTAMLLDRCAKNKKKVMAEAKKPKLGSGGRFKKLAAETGSPALAAWIGTKKYGNEKLSKLSAKGKK